MKCNLVSNPQLPEFRLKIGDLCLEIFPVRVKRRLGDGFERPLSSSAILLSKLDLTVSSSVF
jgi:hypothetical protein